MKSYTDLEQSKKLAEFLPLESADYHYIAQGEKSYHYSYSLSNDAIEQYNGDIKYIPCWSLSALLDVLPDEVGDNHYLTLDKEGKEYCCCYEDCNGNSSLHVFASNPIDACVEMILKLKEKNLI